ncbi:hypothetical protein HDU93_001123, partial [Gonapodya sp. JEL0774]
MIPLLRTRLPLALGHKSLARQSRVSYSVASLTAEKVADWSSPVSEAEMAAIASKHLTSGLARMSDHVVQSASGVWINTVDGKRLLDFTAGIGATST